MISRVCLLLVLLGVMMAPIQGAKRTMRVVYGTDDRLDYFEVSAADQQLGTGVAMFLQGQDLFTSSGEARGTITLGESFNLCPDERYANQLLIDADSSCSGFLVSDDPAWIMTAAHCVDVADYIVFDYDQFQDGPRLTFSEDQLFTVNRVVAVGNPNGDNDYAVLELTRPVFGRQVYTDIAPRATVGTPLHLIGYPSGLPKKFDRGGEITRVETAFYFATLDSEGGNSGSPVFDNSGKIVGILQGGAADFVSDGDCDVTNVCPGGEGCSGGEAVVPICEVVNAFSEVRERLGWTCTQGASSSASPVRSATPSQSRVPASASSTPNPVAVSSSSTPTRLPVSSPAPSNSRTPNAVGASASRTPASAPSASRTRALSASRVPTFAISPSAIPLPYGDDDDSSSGAAHVIGSMVLFLFALL